MKIERSSRFKRSYKKLPAIIKDDFDKKITLFFKHPFDPRLKTHKLQGRLGSYYAFGLTQGYRVLFSFEEDNVVLLVNIGSHDEYAKWAHS